MKRAAADGLTIDCFLYLVGKGYLDAQQRLDAMRAVLSRAPVKRVYITGAAFKYDDADDVMKDLVVLLMIGTQLIICDE